MAWHIMCSDFASQKALKTTTENLCVLMCVGSVREKEINRKRGREKERYT